MNSLNSDRDLSLQHRDLSIEPQHHRGVSGARRGRKRKYHDDALVQLLFLCWLARERMCAKRLVVQIPSWLEEHERVSGTLEHSLRARLLGISAATIDRVIKAKRDEWFLVSAESGDSALSAKLLEVK